MAQDEVKYEPPISGGGGSPLQRTGVGRTGPRADLRSVASYVTQIILADLKRKPGKRKPTKAKPGDNRIAYDVGPMLLIPEREAVRKRAARTLGVSGQRASPRCISGSGCALLESMK